MKCLTADYNQPNYTILCNYIIAGATFFLKIQTKFKSDVPHSNQIQRTSWIHSSKSLIFWTFVQVSRKTFPRSSLQRYTGSLSPYSSSHPRNTKVSSEVFSCLICPPGRVMVAGGDAVVWRWQSCTEAKKNFRMCCIHSGGHCMSADKQSRKTFHPSISCTHAPTLQSLIFRAPVRSRKRDREEGGHEKLS